MACARLDSLANLARTEKSQEQRFATFLAKYADKGNLFSQISVPDFRYFLQFQEWILPGTILKPGRLHVYTDENRFFVRILWKSGLPITLSSAHELLSYLRRCLRSAFRISPRKRSDHKPTHARPSAILSCILRGARGSRLTALRSAEAELKQAIDHYSIGKILYRDYRCKVIHEYAIDIDEDQFFRKQNLYWGVAGNDLFSSQKFLTVTFPARFLYMSLQSCVMNYERYLLGRRRVPIDIFNAEFNLLKELHYLDDDSIQQGRDIQLALERG